MANPKRRHSHARKGKKRTHKKLRPGQLSRCPSCGAAVPPHSLCVSCGYYKNRQVVEFEED